MVNIDTNIQSNIKKWFWGGFGEIKKEITYESLVNPMINGLGMNALFNQCGYTSRWVEHRVFINDKPIFRYKGLKKGELNVYRFLGICCINMKINNEDK